MSVSRRFLVSLLLCLLGAAVALAQPVGPEFRVNTYTTGTPADTLGGLGCGRQLRRRLGELHQDGSDTASSASATPAREPRWAGSSG